VARAGFRHQQGEANRKNARAGTRPRSAAGKRRSARNARRHGLAVAIWSNAELSAQAEALARVIAGSNAGPERLALARPLAEAQVDLIRIRQTQRDLIAPGFSAADTRRVEGLSLRTTRVVTAQVCHPSP
jgi:hypothetical protein